MSLKNPYEFEVNSILATSLDFRLERIIAGTKLLFAIFHFGGYRKA